MICVRPRSFAHWMSHGSLSPRSSVMSTCELKHLRPTSPSTFLNSAALILFRLPNPKLCSEYHGEQSSIDWNAGVGQHLHRARESPGR